MKISTLSYAAGFFDGEGSIIITSRRRKYKNWTIEHILSVAVGQNDGATLDWMKDNFGGRVYLVKRDNSYFWVATNKVALSFLKTIAPFLRYKKPQAELAISFYEGKPEKKLIPLSKEELARRERIRVKLKLLKKSIIASQYAGSTTKRTER